MRGEALDEALLDFIAERITDGYAAFDETIDSDYSEYAEATQSGARLYEIEGVGALSIEIVHAADWAHSYLERVLELSAGAPYELRFFH